MNNAQTTLQSVKPGTLVYLDPSHHTLDKAMKVVGRMSTAPNYIQLDDGGAEVYRHQADPVYPVTGVYLP